VKNEKKRKKMEWIIFSLIGTIFFSAAGVMEKLILGSYTENCKALLVCQVLVSQLFSISVFIIIGANFIYPESVFALIAGFLQILPTIFYLKALQIEEVSKVTALENLYPIFIFIGSVILLGEKLEPRACVGGLLLFVGSFLISFQRNSPNGRASFLTLSSAIKPLILYWILTALYYISIKYILISTDEWNLYIWSSLGNLVAIIPLLGIQSIRYEVKKFFEKGNFVVFTLISTESLMFLGIIFSIFACSTGSITLVSSIGALQPILTLLLVLAASIFIPGLAKKLEENIEWNSLVHKSISFIFVLVGIYFIH
jgi:uncharacterized membrane protein